MAEFNFPMVPEWIVGCGSCGAEGPDGITQQEAFDKWNSRLGTADTMIVAWGDAG